MPQMPIKPPPSYKAAPPYALSADSTMQQVQPEPWTTRLFSALLLFWLLREWLVPLERLSDMTEVYRIEPFLIAFGLFLALDLFRVPGAAGWPLKTAMILVVTAVLHSGQWIPGGSWWAAWLGELSDDVLDIVHGRFAGLEPVTRTMLFLAGWSFFIWVVHSFAEERRQIGWFVLMTLCYLVLLQLVFDLDLSDGLLSATAAGLLLQGSLQPERWLRWKQEPPEETDTTVSSGGLFFHSSKLPKQAEPLFSRFSGMPGGTNPSRHAPSTGHKVTGNAASLTAVFVITGLGLLGAWFGAGQHSQQNKAVDWSGLLQTWEQVFPAWNESEIPIEGRAFSKAKTGYGADDSRMGSPLEPDDGVAFTARTTQLTYWRGEAKPVYTGHGWTGMNSQPVQNVSNAAMTLADSPAALSFSNGAAKTIVRQEVTLMQKGLEGQLFLGGDLVKVDELVSLEGKAVSPEWLWKNKLTDRIHLPVLADPLASYKVEVLAWNQLRPATDSPGSYPVSNEMEQTFLQLPEQLPLRVIRLAESVTNDISSPYEKVKAIQHYLQDGYAYSLDRSRPPSAGQDLVDQFLFEQQAGYCDHFSTAMVVMLRSVGIPARWVKGFAPGEVKSVEPVTNDSTTGSTAAQVYTVEVRNKDAHSWVEVYFPSVGWVPFDPTPGFGGSAASQPSNGASAPVSDNAAVAGETMTGQQLSAAGSRLLHLFASFKERVIHTWQRLSAALSSFANEGFPVLHSKAVWMKPVMTLFLLIVSGGMLLFVHMWMKRRSTGTPLRTLPASVRDQSETGVKRSGMTAWAAVRLSERIWRKLQRRWGAAGPAQTMREYLLTRPYSTDEQRGAMLQLVQLLETVRYHNDCRRITYSRLHDAWRELKKTSNNTR